jgi:hypothetical protein
VTTWTIGEVPHDGPGDTWPEPFTGTLLETWNHVFDVVGNVGTIVSVNHPDQRTAHVTYTTTGDTGPVLVESTIVLMEGVDG